MMQKDYAVLNYYEALSQPNLNVRAKRQTASQDLMRLIPFVHLLYVCT